MDKTIENLIAEVDKEFMRLHPQAKQKLAQNEAAMRKQWNELFVQHAFKAVRDIRDLTAERLKRIDIGA